MYKKLRLPLLAILVGSLSGLGGIIFYLLFEGITHELITEVSTQKQSFYLILVGFVGSWIWFFTQTGGRRLVPIAKQIRPNSLEDRFPKLITQSLHIFWQSISVALGSPIGKEVAPREFATLLSGRFLEKWKVTDKEWTVLMSCAAATGLAAIYQVPFASLLMLFESLKVKLSFQNLLLGFLALYSGSYISGFIIPKGALYQVPDSTINLFDVIYLIFFAFLSFPLARVIRHLIKWAEKERSRTKPILYQLPLVFIMLAVISPYFPDILGNGSRLAQSIFDGLSLDQVFYLFILKLIFVLATLRLGGYGGTLTPSVALGASWGYGIGLVVKLLFPLATISPTLSAVVGSVIFLSTTMNTPFSASALVLAFVGFTTNHVIVILGALCFLLIFDYVTKKYQLF